MAGDPLFRNFSKVFAEGPQCNVCFLTTFCLYKCQNRSSEAPNESGFQIFVLPNTACVGHITVFLNAQEILDTV